MVTPAEMLGAVSRSVTERTGRTMAEWVALVAASGVDPLDQNAVRRWLRDVHGIGLNTQWAIADAVAVQAGWVRPTPEEYAAGQFTGARAALLPVFEAVRDAALALGDDVTMEGRSTLVPFLRRRQFAAVAVPTTTRVDLGLRLPDPPPSPRLQPASAPGTATHRVRLTRVEDVDDEVRDLLGIAYQQNG
jgi:hypothetical protein